MWNVWLHFYVKNDIIRFWKKGNLDLDIYFLKNQAKLIKNTIQISQLKYRKTKTQFILDI